MKWAYPPVLKFSIYIVEQNCKNANSFHPEMELFQVNGRLLGGL